MCKGRTDLLKEVALEAGKTLAAYFGRDFEVHKKGELDLVTAADKETERQIVDAIAARFPQDEIMAEESGQKKGSSSFRWIIDPLDGTTNFAHRFPHFSVSIALAEGDRVIAGAVHDPMKGEFFEAGLGMGATLNGQPLQVSRQSQLNECLAVTGFSYNRRQRMPQLLGRVEKILNHCQGLRRLGSAALDLAYVACGRFDLFVEDGLNAWDIAAGPIVGF